MLYYYNVEVLRVIDGDTLEVRVDLGFRMWKRDHIRLWGIDTPEVRTKDLQEKEAGLEAKAELQRLIDKAMWDGRMIRIHSVGLDKYGRALATLFIEREDMPGQFSNINDHLLVKGFAKEYMRD